MALFCLMHTRGSIKLPTLILFKVAWFLLCRQSYTTALGMAVRTCLVLCYQILNFFASCEAYVFLDSICVIIQFIFVIFGK